MCVDILSELCIDCLDHGVYIIDDWQIVGRAYHASEQTGYKLIDMLMLIDSYMPENERITNSILELEASIDAADSNKSNNNIIIEEYDEHDNIMSNETDESEAYYYEDEKFTNKIIAFFKHQLLKVLQLHIITTLKIKKFL